MLLQNLNGFQQLTQKRQNMHQHTYKTRKETNKAQNSKIEMQQQSKTFGLVCSC